VVAFEGQTDAKLQKLPVTGGTPITLADAAAPAGVSWGDDGSIVFSGGKGLMRISSAGGKPEILTSPDSRKGETVHRAPHFLRGSQALLFTIGSGAAGQVAALDLKTRAYHVVANDGQDGRYAPDGSDGRSGHLVYLRGSTLFAVPFDARKLAVTGSEAPVVKGCPSMAGTSFPSSHFPGTVCSFTWKAPARARERPWDGRTFRANARPSRRPRYGGREDCRPTAG
jgi:hypothetical protein